MLLKIFESFPKDQFKVNSFEKVLKKNYLEAPQNNNCIFEQSCFKITFINEVVQKFVRVYFLPYCNDYNKYLQKQV